MSLDNANPPLVSPFPPIADYGFLSDCETCALVAPSRRDRVDVPAALRRPERVRRAAGPRRGHVPARPGGHDGPRRPPLPPGHDDPRDHLGHRPRLADRPRRAADRPVARHRRALHHAPPRPHRLRRRPRAAAHHALRQRLRRGPDGVRPDLRLRAQVRPLGVRGRRLQRGGRHRRGLGHQAHADHRPARRLRGLARARRDHPARRRHRVRRARVLRSPRPEDLRAGVRPPGQDRRLLAPVARPRHVPGPPVAPVPAAKRPHAEGPVLLAHRRDDRRRDDVAPRDPGRRAQLGLPLQLGPRQHVHALGPALARLRVGGQRLLLLHAGRRPGGRPAGDVRHPGRARTDRGDARSPQRLRQRPPRADRQRRLQPASARRVGHDAGLDLPARQVPRPPARAPLAADQEPRRGGDRELAEARQGHLGGPRRRPALHVLEGHVLGRVRPRIAAGHAARVARAGRRAGARRPTRSRPTSSRRAARTACSRSTTTRRRWTRARC